MQICKFCSGINVFAANFFLYRSHAPAWNAAPDAPASRLTLFNNVALERLEIRYHAGAWERYNPSPVIAGLAA